MVAQWMLRLKVRLATGIDRGTGCAPFQRCSRATAPRRRLWGCAWRPYNRWALSGLGSVSVISKTLAEGPKEQAAQDEFKVWSSLQGRAGEPLLPVSKQVCLTMGPQQG